mmetsp:Transcript_28470/g.87128  ORF Transcript_28470/g.87128 Transcript_28470/m.87128 type:complete len:297 (-) Transcript_28470:175-1065(-)
MPATSICAASSSMFFFSRAAYAISNCVSKCFRSSSFAAASDSAALRCSAMARLTLDRSESACCLILASAATFASASAAASAMDAAHCSRSFSCAVSCALAASRNAFVFSAIIVVRSSSSAFHRSSAAAFRAESFSAATALTAASRSACTARKASSCSLRIAAASFSAFASRVFSTSSAATLSSPASLIASASRLAADANSAEMRSCISFSKRASFSSSPLFCFWSSSFSEARLALFRRSRVSVERIESHTRIASASWVDASSCAALNAYPRHLFLRKQLGTWLAFWCCSTPTELAS